MRPVLRILVLASVTSLTVILPTSAPAQTRAELQRQVTDLNDRIDRLLELNERFALGWQQRELQIQELQEQVKRLQGESTELHSRMTAQQNHFNREMNCIRSSRSSNPFQPELTGNQRPSVPAASGTRHQPQVRVPPSVLAKSYPRPPTVTYYGWKEVPLKIVRRRNRVRQALVTTNVSFPS